MEVKAELLQMREEGAHHTGVPFKRREARPNARTIEEEEVVDEEDIDDGENIFMQKKEEGVVNKNWVLLDSQSNINQVCNPAMLTNIRRAWSPSKIHCNARSTGSMLEGNFGSITVKHSPYRIANVLLLNKAKQQH